MPSHYARRALLTLLAFLALGFFFEWGIADWAPWLADAQPLLPFGLFVHEPSPAQPTPATVTEIAVSPPPTPPSAQAMATALAPTPTATPNPSPTALPVTLKPNELGRIMILEYHLIGPEESRWTRSYANFRQDLERFYSSGYRPIGLDDYIENRIDVPAGKTPIIITFDDSSPGQFRYLQGSDGEPVIDPDSAVGILVAFHDKHPDWRLRGTFFVLAGVEPEHRLFGQPEYAERKLRALVDMGFELGNHTYHHVALSTLDAAGTAKQLGLAVRSIDDILPGYSVDSLALPLGEHAKDIRWAVAGSYKGTAYRNRAILEVTGGSAYSPNHQKADLLHLPRIQATNMEWDFYTAFLDYYDAHPQERYVSDGDPDRLVFPTSLRADYRATAPETGSQQESAPGLLAVRLR